MHYQLPPLCNPRIFLISPSLSLTPFSHLFLSLLLSQLSLPLTSPSLSHSPSYVSLNHYTSIPPSSYLSLPLSLTPPSCIINSHHLATRKLSIYSLFISLNLSFLYPSHSSISLPLSSLPIPNP